MEFGMPLLLEEAIEREVKSATQAKSVGALGTQKYHEQVAGWLRELKELRVTKREFDKFIERNGLRI